MITREEVINLCNLAKLSINKREIDCISSDLTKIVHFVNQVNNAETEALKLSSNKISFQNLREDKIKESFSREETLKNAQNKDGYFYVDTYFK
ncbi:MAG: Asp-tRNA(Asn)/Glu-tRNA(Gln) amidotransferase subunit GatC [Candidatus Paraimprobicoccus trichonymphae]|uniref:Asp-tRNA(Asn)/Glu-tRNA(Gln) amidotransferase subunit GatC n=1 Tax=Candidatus Paraimprobicoccus trichonymphae TaxID=3033793 RepID=A0AA48HZK5_9FIRM|nr:MAG: Asp-tRNA(Asn)/Glu-tRNA(Gln) amidotransferase subunit GatC [Candidatus Paraimprobicoccus trichonymphae]